MPTLFASLTAALLGALLSAPCFAGDEELIAAQLPSYPLETCVVSGEPLGGEDMGEPVDEIHDGKLVRFCCKGCLKDFRKDPAPFVQKIDDAVVTAQRAEYPLESCPACDAKLGDDAVDMVHGTRLVRMCGVECARQHGPDDRKILARVDAAYIEVLRKRYAHQTCPVSGEALDDGAVDHLYGTRLVRLCCKKCLREFGKNPRKYLAALDAAPERRGEGGGPERRGGGEDPTRGGGSAGGGEGRGGR